ncbi:radical SAM protein [Candidatus Woesearchaeota archaeon]|nr:radical SAM protein [Candidatus Woesearchaeota archaeon]
MKIMLIEPYLKEGLKGFPLGLSYIAGALKEENYEVIGLDLTARAFIEGKDPVKILEEDLKKHNPDIVGIRSTSPTHKNALDVAKIVKRYKNIPIIKGGPHETNCAETTLKNNSEIDYSVIGEGEETIKELINRISSKKSIKGLEGVIYRDNGEVINNGKRSLIENLDNLPIPAREIFYLDKRFDDYYSANIFEGRKSTSIMTSRGCPYACSFCSSKANWKGIRQRSVDNVVKEIEQLYNKGYRGFMFEDDMSLANKKWFLEFADKIKDLKIEYTLQTRADAIDEDIAKKLSESGCKYMYFGIESGVQNILDKCGKGITLEDAKNAFKLTKKYKIKSMATMQFGLDGEDLDGLSTVRETIRVLNEELMPDEVAISYTCLYPGSPIANKEGVTPDMYENYIKTSADKKIYRKTAHGTHSIHPKGLTSAKIQEIEKILDSELKIKRFEVDTFYKT